MRGLWVAVLPLPSAAHPLFERPVLVPRAVTSWIGALLLWSLVAFGTWGTHDPWRTSCHSRSGR